MPRIRHIWAILEKDLRDSYRNKTVLMILLAPVMLAIVFNLMFKTENLRRPALIFSGGETKFADYIAKKGGFDVQKNIDMDKAKNMIREGKASAMLIIPENFDHKLNEGLIPTLQIYVNDVDIPQGAIIQMGLTELLRNYAGQVTPAKLTIIPLVREGDGLAQRLLPVWLLFTTLGAFSIAAASLLEERERHTLSALMLSPATPLEVVIGKTLLGTLLAFTAGGMILLFFGGVGMNTAAVLGLILLGSFIFAGMGMLCGSLFNSQTAGQAANSIIYLFFFLPVLMADSSIFMNKIARFLPSFYLYDGLKEAIFLGGGIGKMAVDLAVLGACMIFLLAMTRFSLQRIELAT
ncbi:MAG: ABC transporter permease [Chloroflexi bacterium]|nr:ABC transporter permease [Chloroflexota bacterium]